ncbi:MAG: alpha/beta hydrolase [Acetobacteraceae bacterium]|nr:alpha/beta hydrolase [Acetobacteraceae bacterium]
MLAREVSARDGLLLAIDEYQGDPGRLPVLCLSGLLRNGADFAELAGRIAPQRRVLAPHWRGRGRSGRTRDWRSYAAPFLLAELLDMLAALNVPRAHVIGTSLGGLIGLGLATVRPNAIASLVLNDIGPALAASGLESVRRATLHTPPQPDLAAAAAYLRARLPSLSLRTEDEWQRFARATFREQGGRWVPDWDPAIARTLDQPLPDLWPLWQGAARLPLLLVHGGASDILAPATVARMRTTRPDMAVTTLAGVGHAPTLSEPAAASALDTFLEGMP